MKEIDKSDKFQSPMKRLMTFTAFLGHTDASESLFKEYATQDRLRPTASMYHQQR